MPAPTRTLLALATSAALAATVGIGGVAGSAPAGAAPGPVAGTAVGPMAGPVAGPVADRAAVATARRHVKRIDSKPVAFRLTNNVSDLATILACGLDQPDRREHVVRGRLTGPAAVLAGRTLPPVVDVLVHDAGTGGWFWHLPGQPRYDYASQLAHRGHTTLSLDLLGYGASPLTVGTGTCLGAQVDMLHQVVEDVIAGLYHYDLPRGHRLSPPAAGRVVVTGHGTGATLAQLEASMFRDTAATVLMSPPSTSDSALVNQITRAQSTVCSGPATYAPFGTPAQYRSALFRTAPHAVRATATRLRQSTPCGDVSSRATALLQQAAASSKVPTLVLRGGADASPAATISGPVTTRTIAGAGDALPLERSAPRLRSLVLSWLTRRGLR